MDENDQNAHDNRDIANVLNGFSNPEMRGSLV
jgi:hypothetical protein